MHDALTAILCTLIVAAGWYYLARSQFVQSLQGIETPRRNAARHKARRLGALSMILLAPSFFWLIYETNPEASRVSVPRASAAMLLTIFALVSMMICVTADVYLTLRVRQQLRQQAKPPQYP